MWNLKILQIRKEVLAPKSFFECPGFSRDSYVYSAAIEAIESPSRIFMMRTP